MLKYRDQMMIRNVAKLNASSFIYINCFIISYTCNLFYNFLKIKYLKIFIEQTSNDFNIILQFVDRSLKIFNNIK